MLPTNQQSHNCAHCFAKLSVPTIHSAFHMVQFGLGGKWISDSKVTRTTLPILVQNLVRFILGLEAKPLRPGLQWIPDFPILCGIRTPYCGGSFGFIPGCPYALDGYRIVDLTRFHAWSTAHLGSLLSHVGLDTSITFPGRASGDVPSLVVDMPLFCLYGGSRIKKRDPRTSITHNPSKAMRSTWRKAFGVMARRSAAVTGPR